MNTGLIRRNGRYSTRRVIPLDLQAHYGRREIVKALGTSDPKEAKSRHAAMWAALYAEFEEVRGTLIASSARLTPDNLNSPQSRGVRKANRTISDEQFMWEMEQMELQANHSLEMDFDDEERWALEEKIEARLLDPKADLTPEEAAMRGLLRHYIEKVEVAKIRETSARLMGAKEAEARELASPAAEPAAPEKGTRLSAIVDSWATDRRPKARTIDRTRNIVDRFVAVNGELTVEAVTKHHIIAFRERLLAEGQTAANINVMIPMLGTIFNHAIKSLHLIQVNPAASVGVSDMRRAKEKRRAFSDAEVQAIFTSPVYSEGRRPAAGGGEAAYWLPLLALYTGARQTELGQLHPDDVAQETYLDAEGGEHAAWIIRIVENPDRGQWVKNEGSERRIPIHADLIALGFLKVAQAAKTKGTSRIFDEISPNSVGELMGNWSKWFGRYRRKECGLTGKDTPFHSFRHSFKHYARLSSIPNDVHNELTGHETGDVADAYGGLSYPLAPLVAGMKAYRVPGFKLPSPP